MTVVQLRTRCGAVRTMSASLPLPRMLEFSLEQEVKLFFQPEEVLIGPPTDSRRTFRLESCDGVIAKYQEVKSGG